jgi:ribosomal protein S18 acetylase RimI-like enzyme
MIAALSSSLENSDHIRKMDISRDLNAVADLIERCFPIHLDKDGQTYIKQMRQAARDMRYVRWLSTFADVSENRASGFVWEENGQILGNLSLIPFQQDGERIHLIANVAVQREYRRKGIARALTERAIGYLRRQHEPRIWLQVRKDNFGAQSLYRSVGFTDQFIRTTWHIKPKDLIRNESVSPENLTIQKRKIADWDDQRSWLVDTYPPRLRWNLPVDFNRFEPGTFQSLINVLEGVRLKHWTIESSGKPTGVVTWQKTNTFANNLWLAFDPDTEETALTWALTQVVSQLPGLHPLSVDYASDRHPETFGNLGFHNFRTLIWMVCPLK